MVIERVWEGERSGQTKAGCYNYNGYNGSDDKSTHKLQLHKVQVLNMLFHNSFVLIKVPYCNFQGPNRKNQGVLHILIEFEIQRQVCIGF